VTCFFLCSDNPQKCCKYARQRKDESYLLRCKIILGDVKVNIWICVLLVQLFLSFSYYAIFVCTAFCYTVEVIGNQSVVPCLNYIVCVLCVYSILDFAFCHGSLFYVTFFYYVKFCSVWPDSLICHLCCRNILQEKRIAACRESL